MKLIDIFEGDVVDFESHLSKKRDGDMKELASKIDNMMNDMPSEPSGNADPHTMATLGRLDDYITNAVHEYMSSNYDDPSDWADSDDDYQEGPIPEDEFFSGLQNDFAYRKLYNDVVKIIGVDKTERFVANMFDDALIGYH